MFGLSLDPAVHAEYKIEKDTVVLFKKVILNMEDNHSIKQLTVLTLLFTCLFKVTI